jgi:hypothetical protein
MPGDRPGSSAVAATLAVGGAVLALAATTVEWRAVAAQQVIHPLTAFYFIEAPCLALLAAWSVWIRGSAVQWLMTGALFAFCIIGGFSIGPAYLPAAFLLGAAAIWRDSRAWRRIPGRLGLACVAATAQAAMMLILIRVR